MAIKKLQNNYTTPEQSKRLLELGLPADSADCIFTRFSRDEKWKRKFIEDIVSTHPFCYQDFYLPCWSVGRLIEIWLHCNKFSIDSTSEPITIGLIDFSDNFIDDFIHLIKKAVGSKHIDFSKLED